jgi:hypothetical protein
MESEPILFPKDQVIAGARACLEKVVKAFTFKMPRHNESTDFGERMGNIKD